MPQAPTRAVDRALDILLCFTQDEPALTLTQIANRVGMHKSTVFRLLSTLESKRFVQRDEETQTYRLGLGLVELGFLVLKSNDVHRQAVPYMQRLVADYHETVDLAILQGPNVLYLQVVESSQRVKISSAPGQRLPAFCTASGKAFLAYLGEEKVKEIFKASTIRKYTEQTTTTLRELQEQLAVTRERGYAVSEEEYDVGINAVAAPILNGSRYPVASMAIVGPAFRLTSNRLLELGQALRAAADAIARDIGLTLSLAG